MNTEAKESNLYVNLASFLSTDTFLHGSDGLADLSHCLGQVGDEGVCGGVQGAQAWKEVWHQGVSHMI